MISGITRTDVLKALDEAARVGPELFRSWHGYGRGAYTLAVNGREVDSKAIVGVAARRVVGRELRPSEFSGGAAHSAGLLVRMGFEVRCEGEVLTEDMLTRRLVLRPRTADLRLYVCRPTGDRCIAACYEHNFGALLSPISTRTTRVRTAAGDLDVAVTRVRVTDMSGHANPLPGLPYVLDNGVWSCTEAGVDWSDEPLLRLLSRLSSGPPPNFVVAPDIIGGGADSLAFSVEWLRSRRSELGHLPWMLAVQDGMTVEEVRAAVLEHRFAGLFIGGSTIWKWSTLHEWAGVGLSLGVRVHVGRVNSQRRARICRDLGISSIDGSIVSRFSDVKAPLMAVHCDGEELPATTDVQLSIFGAGRE